MESTTSKASKVLSVQELGPRRREVFPAKGPVGSGVVFDPRPSSYHDLDIKAYIEKLRCDLQDLNQPCGFLNILIPDPTKIQHDHCYNTQYDSIQPMLITHTSPESVGDNYDDR